MTKITKIQNYFFSALYINGYLYSMGEDVSKHLEELLLDNSGVEISFEVISLDDEVVMSIMSKFAARFPNSLTDLQNEL